MAPRGKKAELLPRLVEMNADGMTVADACVELGVHPVTASTWFKDEGITPVFVRTGRKAGGPGSVTYTCEQCGAEIKGVASRPRRFCSRGCGNDWQRENADSVTIVCPCGEEFTVRPSSADRKYCSKGCADRYQVRRVRDPSKWVTKVCQNEACGKEFEIRTSSRSYGKYCSNACAYRHTKTKQHIVVDDAVVLDSGWEALFWGLCAFDKIACERYDRAQGVEVGEGWYAPDFWLPGLQTAVEIKGVEDSDDPERWEVWRAVTGHRLLVLDRSALDQLLMAGDRERWLRGGDWPLAPAGGLLPCWGR